MAQLVLAGLGAAIGSVFGPVGTSIGWSLGSVAGAALFGPEQRFEGPRLTELRVQSSAYGQMLPLTLGTPRIAGNVIDASDLRETRNEESVGKGGAATQTTYSYDVDLDIAICAGEKAAIRRIWADGRLVYDASDTASAATVQASNQFRRWFTFYPGSATQSPDPTFEALRGAGQVPAYRGICHVVFTALPLADYGNRVPNFEFEVADLGALHYLRELEADTGVGAGKARFTGDGFVYSITQTVATLTTQHARYRHVIGGGADQLVHLELLMQPSGIFTLDEYKTIGNAPDLWLTQRQGAGSDGAFWWYNLGPSEPVTNRFGEGDYWSAPYHSLSDTSVDHGGLYFVQQSQTHGWWLTRYDLVRTPEGNYLPPRDPAGALWLDSLAVAVSFWNVLLDEVTGTLYAYNGDALYEIDKDRMVATGASWSFGDASEFGGCVHGGLFAFHARTAPNGPVRVYRINPGGSATLLDSINYFGSASVINAIGGGAFQMDIGSTHALLQIGETVAASTRTLADLVTLVCGEAGLSPTQIDVTPLTDTVRAWALTSQSSAAACLAQTTPVYQFDAFEADGKLRFVKRGGSAVASLTIDDLIDADPPYEVLSAKETDLPRSVAVRFFNVNADYQLGSQPAVRQITSSQQNTTIDAPFGLTDAEAASVAQVNLYQAWAQRARWRFALPIRHIERTPTDVIDLAADSGVVRLQLRRVGIDGMQLKFEAVEVDSLALTLNSSAQQASASQVVPLTTVETMWELADIPALRDEDGDAIHYYAGGDSGYAASAQWPGAQLFRSADAGVSWQGVGALLKPAVIGRTTIALADWTGGDVVDEGSVLKVVLRGTATLTSCTHGQLLSGQNVYLVGAEIVGVRDWSYASGVWTGRGLLRGMRGSEYACSGHTGAERFMRLAQDGTIIRFDGAAGDTGQSRLYRAVTFGASLLAPTETKSLLSSCNSTKPLAPVHLGAWRMPNGDVQITATRRDRKFQGCFDFVDAPMSEETLAYDVEVLAGDDVTVARTFSSTGLPVVWTAAQQTADIGHSAANFLCNVYQRSALVGRGQRGQRRLLRPIVYGPRSYEDGLVPADHLPSSANGSLSVVSDAGSQRLRMAYAAGTTPRCRIGGIGPFKNGRITVDTRDIQQPGPTCALVFRTNNWSETGTVGWRLHYSGDTYFLQYGADTTSGSYTQVATGGLGVATVNYFTLRVVIIDTYIEVWAGAIGGGLVRVFSGTNANLNQTGYAGFMASSSSGAAAQYWDNLMIESFD